MGNGPGGLVEYIEMFRDLPTMQGGFVWEFNNHGLLKEEANRSYYAYGGDYGGVPNDGDFIMDGLTLSDHTPMPSIFQYAKVIQPVTTKLTEDKSQLVIVNHYDFIDLSGLNPTWHLVQDGKTTEPQALELPRIPGGKNFTLDLPLNAKDLSHEAWIIVEFALKEDKPWAEKGHVVAWDQMYLAGPATKGSTAVQQRDGGGAHVSRSNRTRVEVENGPSKFHFDLLQGNVTWNVNGFEVLQQGPEISLYRAMTQNDEASAGDGGDWEAAYLSTVHTQVRGVSWQETAEGVTVHQKLWVAPKVLDWGVEAELVYTVTPSGSLRIHARGEFAGETKPEVVGRIGLFAILPREFDQVSWFGRGQGESYKDSKDAWRIGQYNSSVEDLFTYYDYPQENGSREDLRWVRLAAPGKGVTIDARRIDQSANSTVTTGEDQKFSFTARHYLPSDLDRAKHPFDLTPWDFTALNLDYDIHGVGSATVGPRPFPQHSCYAEPFDFVFELSLV